MKELKLTESLSACFQILSTYTGEKIAHRDDLPPWEDLTLNQIKSIVPILEALARVQAVIKERKIKGV